ncbi:xanthine dehydrogenase family protein molybdopterin-binding subunit [Phenylobacterium aquaticum]|uniref:xanthine dehydrogenase family protein molybdopterin-binding subunit n=1 Tax=Phenylobacterium aquaticum TaxID=1763816 RepID=UPI001F5CC34D|nr:xanthine dehydrogenase family protein molybdopterin-binding subunit [Phenylobacterium aquaticum]MCI3131217.1 xanthine dehydrogenase family protein molybdopterin-binding subunit [Phenylobacterium aquaticum]
MSLETPAPLTPYPRHGSNSGQPISRRDGELKVTGQATYAADNHPPGLLYAVTAVSSIARGRVAALDVAAAKAHPGVVEVITPANRPPLSHDPDVKLGMFGFRIEVLQDDKVRYANQPIALVLAESLEAAVEGAALLRPRYEVEPARTGLGNGDRYAPAAVGVGAPPRTAFGDLDAGFAAADQVIEAEFTTPAQFHNAMEPHAVVAQWDGDHLTLDMPNQALVMSREAYAAYFGVPGENVLIRSPFLGGGFGSKAILNGPQILAILAARHMRRPVKLVLSRAQMYGPVGHRGRTWQTLRLGVDGEGRLTAMHHHSLAATSSFEDFLEPAANASLHAYASPAILSQTEGLRLDIGTPGPMRAPGEASGSAALEVAMDEAALACGMDPLAFRLKNFAETEPGTGRPYSSNALRECYAEGAKAFGWAGRPLQPRQMRDKDGLLVGWGMGTALFPCPHFPAEARATLRADGTALVETAGVDMGQGAWTALAQIAAEALGLDPEQVEFRSGVSDLPDAGVAGGSGHTASAGLALHNAGQNVIARLAELAGADPASPLFGAGNIGVVAKGGRLHRRDDEGRSESYADILARTGQTELVGTGRMARDEEAVQAWAMYSHGAVFAEVKVDPDLGMVRATRLVGAFAAGRIINPKLVRSQYYGGMIWGVSFALQEAAIADPRTGRIMNADLAEYRIPVNADVPSLEAILVPEDDRYVNPLGVKGVGEIGITGTVGAIANAVWHATGVRVRRFPIQIEDLLGGG